MQETQSEPRTAGNVKHHWNMAVWESKRSWISMESDLEVDLVSAVVHGSYLWFVCFQNQKFGKIYLITLPFILFILIELLTIKKIMVKNWF